jgi:RHS repeat-associated protein
MTRPSTDTMRLNMPMMQSEAGPAHLGETFCHAYDNNGNTLTKVSGSNTTSYAWDFENRLTSVTLPVSGGTVSFKYDPFGRRIYKSSSSGTSIYAYDGVNLIEETNASGGVLARYAQGMHVDEPLGMLRSSATSYYEADGLGSVTSLSNAAGALAQTYTFDSFGKQTASTGSLTNPFQYTARELDPETNLYYYPARYYDPAAGRFLNEDPRGFNSGDGNFYEYTLDDPINHTDASGMQAEPLPVPVPASDPWLPGWFGWLRDLSLGGAGFQTDPWGRLYSPSLDPTNLSPLQPPPSPKPPAAPSTSPDPSAQRQNEYEKYKKRCNEPAPPGLDPCALARWMLQRNVDCRNMRKAWDDKWYPGRHTNDINNLDIGIQRLKDWIAKNCKNDCK